MTRQSGYIFAGTVAGVERIAPQSSNGLATVQVSFRVDQAIRGVRTGQVLVVREWAGLWENGSRYRVGERLLLFLYRPSKLGLTSPVAGGLGRFAMDSNGQVVLEEARHAAVLRDAVISGVVSAVPGKKAVLINRRAFARAIRRAEEE